MSWVDQIAAAFAVGCDSRPQRTLAESVRLTGRGLHTGKAAEIILQPADVDFGIQFRHAGMNDSEPRTRFGYLADHTTSAFVGTAKFSCIEHLMAALHGLAITNCRVMFRSGDEVPYFDGSARPIVEQILRAGLVPQDALALTATVKTPAFCLIGDGASIGVEPFDGFVVTARIEFPDPIGMQQGRWSIEEHSFAGGIGRARTFLKDSVDRVPYEEVRRTRLKGLPAEPADCQFITYNDMGYLSAARSEDECVQHKALDFVGDIFTSGCLLKGHFILHRPGHRSNLLLAQHLRGLHEGDRKGDG